MKKIKIQIVKLGNQPCDKLFDKLEKYKSALFEVEVFEKSIEKRGREYSFEELAMLLVSGFNCDKHDMCIGFINERIEKNYYTRMLDRPCVYAVSFFEIEEIIKSDNNKIFNYMLMTIYRCITKFVLGGKIYVHGAARGCLFDMCENKSEVAAICNKPTICQSCMEDIKRKGIETGFIKTLPKEIRRIRKPIYCEVKEFVKKHPFIAAVLGFASAVTVNIASTMVLELIKKL